MQYSLQSEYIAAIQYKTELCCLCGYIEHHIILIFLASDPYTNLTRLNALDNFLQVYWFFMCIEWCV